MNTFDLIYLFCAFYVAIGLGIAVLLKQTPYAENPLWLMVLLWPLYLWNL